MSGIHRFRKRPVEVEAVQWTGTNLPELLAFTGGRFRPANPENRTEGFQATAEVFDYLHATWVGVGTGHWVAKGVKGEFYPIEETVLAETYRSGRPNLEDLEDQIRDVTWQIDGLIDGGKPLSALKAVLLANEIKARELAAVDRAVQAGSTWLDIATVIGVSRQAAWVRYGRGRNRKTRDDVVS